MATEQPAQETSPAVKTAEKRAPSKSYHISYRKKDDKWIVKVTGSDEVLQSFDTQEEALAFSKPLAENQGVNIVVHKKKQ